MATAARSRVGRLLGIPATILPLIQAVTGDDALLAYSSAFEALPYFHAGGALISYMLADHVIARHGLPGDRPDGRSQLDGAAVPELHVVPVRPFARGLSMLEQLAGLAYVAMVVSRLVGLMVMRRADRD